MKLIRKPKYQPPKRYITTEYLWLPLEDTKMTSKSAMTSS